MVTMIGEYPVDHNPSIARTAAPYVVGALALGVASSYVAVVTYASPSPIIPAIAAIVGLMALYSAYAIVEEAAYARNTKEFYKGMQRSAGLYSFYVVMEVTGRVASSVIDGLIARILFKP